MARPKAFRSRAYLIVCSNASSARPSDTVGLRYRWVLNANSSFRNPLSDAAQVEMNRSQTVGLATSTSRVDCGVFTAGNCSTVAMTLAQTRKQHDLAVGKF
jgi:hypothetical protein